MSDAWPPPAWAAPAMPPHPPADPLVSPDLGGWFARYRTALRNGWRQLALLQSVYLLATVGAVALAWGPVSAAFGDVLRSADDPQPPTAALLTMVVWTVAGVLVLSLVQVLVGLATLHVTATAALGTPAGAGAALVVAVRRLPMMLGWALLSAPMLLVGFVLCYVPGLYLTAVLITLPAIVLYERGAGIGRCFQLFHHDFGAALSRIAVLAGIYFATTTAASIPSYAILVGESLMAGPDAEPTLPGRGLVIGSGVSMLVATAVIGLVIQPLSLFVYTDLRARYEPFTAADLFRN